jgi:integrase
MARERSRRPRGPYQRTDRPGWYGDFRSYGDVGGRQEGLVTEGATRTTEDYAVAVQLYAARHKQLEQARRDGVLLGQTKRRQLAEYVAYHLEQKAKTGKVEARWIECAETFLRRAVEHFGAARYLDTLGVAEVQAWLVGLGEGKDTTRPLAAGSVRHHLNALSNLYRRAGSEGVVAPGYNPASAILEKPSGHDRTESSFLEVHDGALLLEAARLPLVQVNAHPTRHAHARVGAFLLTGGRVREVLGLETEDVSFDRQVITFRPNQWRRLKTKKSRRTVPLWPQLEEILRAYVFNPERPPTRLLFPAEDGGMLRDIRGLLDRLGERAGWKAGEIRARMFRHTYCSARLQTLDHGAPVSPYTAAKELGHGGQSMVDRVYGHLGTVRHRAGVVEYRVEQHAAILGDRLELLRAPFVPVSVPAPKTELKAS